MRISDWSSDVCSSDLASPHPHASRHRARKQPLPRGGVPGWRKGGERTSPLGLLEKVDQFAALLFLFVSVTAGDRLCHAARGMALENFALCATKSGLDCPDLLPDVGSVTIVLDHLG